MFCRVFGGAWHGIDGRLVRVEADAGNGLPSFHIVGEISAEVRESGMRIRTARQKFRIFSAAQTLSGKSGPIRISEVGDRI